MNQKLSVHSQDSCYYDGKDNCTDGDCAFILWNTDILWSSIKTAKSGGAPQACWKVTDTSGSTTACVPRQCSQAPTTNNTNIPFCDQFMKGCLWNGTSAGGCQDPTTACTLIQGRLILNVRHFQNPVNSVDVQVLWPVLDQLLVPYIISTIKVQHRVSIRASYQYVMDILANGYELVDSCATPSTIWPLHQLTQHQEQMMWQNNNIARPQCIQAVPGLLICYWGQLQLGQMRGLYCLVATDADAQALYCKSLKINGRGGLCALTNTSGIKCSSTSQCSNYDVKTKEACQQLSACVLSGIPVIQKTYEIPDGFTKYLNYKYTVLDKHHTASTACGIQISSGSRLLGGSLVCSDFSRIMLSQYDCYLQVQIYVYS
ncbi:hypothetical protein pb186bvf_017313 [Paramecium bursaria]